jgi:hypothetical protein
LADAGLSEYAWEIAGPIWYESLIHENMKPHCSFKEFAIITCNIAHQKSTEAERVVKTAWETVGILEPPPANINRAEVEELLESLLNLQVQNISEYTRAESQF